MTTYTREESPYCSLRYHWPQIFTERRALNDCSRESENRPYIDFAQSPCYIGEGDEDALSDEQDWIIDDDEVEEEDEEEGEDTENPDQVDEVSNARSIVRTFMEGMTGDEETLLYPDQVEQVAGFYEQRNLGPLKAAGQDRNYVALLDQRNLCGAAQTNCGRSPCPGHSRPHLGPLTAENLSKELERQRLKLSSDQDGDRYAAESWDCDAERRTICIVHLSPSTIEVLTRTATIHQAPAMRDLLYKHLTGKTSVGVTIPSKGFRTFTLECHIPYCAMRSSVELLKDARLKSGGKPLRESWKLPCLFKQQNQQASNTGVLCLYEAQMSVVVTGTSHWLWVAFGLFDDYFEAKDILAAYNQLNGTKGRRKGPKGRADPLSCGRNDAEKPIWTPREYFFEVIKIRVNQVLREWNGIYLWVETEVKQSRVHPIFLLPSSSLKSEQAREFCTWCLQMVNVLRNLISKLSDTVSAWKEFKLSDIDYFQDGIEPLSSDSQLKASIIAVDRAISSLNALLPKFENLEKKLCNDNPQGLNAHLSIENHEAAMSQLATGRNVQVLIVVTVVFLPLVIDASLFSTTEVLSLAPHFGNFVLVLVLLMILVGTTVVVASFNLPSCLEGMIALIDRLRNARISSEKQRVKKITLDNVITKLRDVTRRVFDTCASSQGDLEMGFSYSPVSTGDRGQHDLGSFSRGDTTLPTTNTIVSWEAGTCTTPSNSHFSRVRRPRYKKSLFGPFTSIQNKLKRLLRPLPEADRQRIEWTCGCGHELYADLSSNSPSEIFRLASLLQCTGYPTPIHGSDSTITLSTLPPQESVANRTQSSSSSQISTSASSTLLGSGSRPSSISTQRPPSRSYLELCVNTGKYAKTLSEIDLQHITSDGDLFEQIRSEYSRLRKFQLNLWLLKPSGVQFVKFSVQESLQVGILQSPLSIPPQQEVDLQRYTYSPYPPRDEPPMPSNLFLHYLTCTAYDPSSAWITRLPKKLDTSIIPARGSINEGWGIHINEGPNWFVIGVMNLILMTLSGLAAGMWKVYTNDFQGAFGFAGWIVGVVNAILLVYIARWNGS